MYTSNLCVFVVVVCVGMCVRVDIRVMWHAYMQLCFL